MSAIALPAVPAAARMARCFVRDSFATSDALMLDRVTLCVSELVTNALDHAFPPFELRAGRLANRLRVEVHDASDRTPVRREYSPTSLRGRGMHLVDESSTIWGVDVRPEGKIVWAEFDEGATLPRPF